MRNPILIFGRTRYSSYESSPEQVSVRSLYMSYTIEKTSEKGTHYIKSNQAQHTMAYCVIKYSLSAKLSLLRCWYLQ